MKCSFCGLDRSQCMGSREWAAPAQVQRIARLPAFTRSQRDALASRVSAYQQRLLEAVA